MSKLDEGELEKYGEAVVLGFLSRRIIDEREELNVDGNRNGVCLCLRFAGC